MVKTGRAIILIDDKIVTIKRTKYKDKSIVKEYYTFPGGHVEDGESFEIATIRELKEELGIDTIIDKEYIHIYNKDLNRNEKFFICSYVSGEFGTGNGPEFTDTNYEKYGKYEIVLLEKNKIKNYNLLPIEVKELLIEDIKNNKI